MLVKKLMTFVVSALSAAVAFGADYYVDYANGVDEEGRGGSDAPFKTIAYAIGRTDAAGHDVIHLMKGNHGVSEKLTLDHAVDLIGATELQEHFSLAGAEPGLVDVELSADEFQHLLCRCDRVRGSL